MDRFEAMSLLISSVEAGSFSAASRKLHVPLPTLSRKVSELEALHKTKLLTRSTRKLSLTAAGAAYVSASRRILEQVGEAEAQAAGEFAAPRGELIVTGPMTFGRIHLLPIVNDFHSQISDLQLGEVMGREKKMSLKLDKRESLDARRSAFLWKRRAWSRPAGP